MRTILSITIISFLTACASDSGFTIDYNHPTNSYDKIEIDASTCKAEGNKIAGPRPQYSEVRTTAAKLEHKEAMRVRYDAYIPGFTSCMYIRGYGVTGLRGYGVTAKPF